MNKKHQEEFHNRINMFSNHQRSVNGPVLHENNHGADNAYCRLKLHAPLVFHSISHTIHFKKI